MPKFKFPKIPFKTHMLDNGMQTWVKRVHLYPDKYLEKTQDWTIGFLFCEHCGAMQGFAFKIPPVGTIPPENPEAKKMHRKFLVEHCHGDGRAILFNQD